MTPPRVCIVDDEPAFRRLCETILASEGYLCEWVEDLPRAAEEIEASRPDVVVLDIRLGTEADGLQVLVDLTRADSPTRNIPIVICTASRDLLHAHEKLIEELGCQVVEKPFQLEDFIGAIQACLDHSRAAA
jgi:DNA-binding NtrC family response regulator